MNVKVFTNVFEQRPGLFVFNRPTDVRVLNGLDQNMAAFLAKEFGAPIKKSYQSSGDDNGLIIIGLRYKPVAIIVPEGHPSFDAPFIVTYKLAK